MKTIRTFTLDHSLIRETVRQSENIYCTTIVTGFTSKFTLGGAIILASISQMVEAFLYTDTLRLLLGQETDQKHLDKQLVERSGFDSLEISNCVFLYNTSGGNVNHHNSRPNEEIINAVWMKTLIFYTVSNIFKIRFRASLIKSNSNLYTLGI